MTTTTTHHDDATTWRDFADQLPAHVIQRFERHERLTELHGPLAFPGEEPAEVIRKDQELMLKEAREQISFAHVPMPAAATWSDVWQDDGKGNWSRVVDGTSRSSGPLTVDIMGVQSAVDGSVSWSVNAEYRGDLTSEVSRQYAALLTEAAEEIDRLNG